MGRLRDGVSHEQANAALQQHLARRARGHDEPQPTRRPARQVSRPDRPRSSLARRDSHACGGRSASRCAFSSRSSGCFSPSRVPAPPTCCSRAASRASARSPCGWPSEPAARVSSGSSSPNRSSRRPSLPRVGMLFASWIGNVPRRDDDVPRRVPDRHRRSARTGASCSSRSRLTLTTGRSLFRASGAARHAARPGCDAEGNRRRRGTLLRRWSLGRLLVVSQVADHDGAAGRRGAVRAQPDNRACRRTPASIATTCSSSRRMPKPPATKASG